ncbi:MAG: hydrogenase iron-sulfur subunit [Desulfobacteraceae bacterium]|nr:MAG: hydrogenase iron-sulfur subunit [Desulfobacteraceae bacterium]
MKIHIFYCSNCLDTDALRKQLEINGNGQGDHQIQTVSLPCSGKVNLLYLLKAFEKGSDGVLLVTCEHGECKFLEGNLRARKRAKAVESMLEEAGLGKGRMIVVRKSEEGIGQITAALEQLTDNILQDTERSQE